MEIRHGAQATSGRKANATDWISYQGLQPLLQKLKEGETLKPHRLGEWFVILSS